jgi:hypothetical protein
MNTNSLIERLVAHVTVPLRHAPVYAVRHYSIEELTSRARRLIASVSDARNMSMDRGDWVRQADHTIVRLPAGAQGMIYHASGAMRITMGLNPMESLFPKVEPHEQLERLVRGAADRLRLAEWVGHNESLSFERLWQIKAAAAGRNARVVEPVLCRIVGAYRHHVGELPGWGAASAAIKLAAGGELDSISIQLRDPAGEMMERVPVVSPDEAARDIVLQLASLMGQSKTPFTELATPQWMRFGYLSLGKRQSQRVLAPHYVAAIGIRGEESQAYLLVTPATEKTYLPVSRAGKNPPPAEVRRHTGDSRPPTFAGGNVRPMSTVA